MNEPWLDNAACRPDKRWTPDYEPRAEIMAELRAVCDRCPVLRECANFALRRNLGAGVYAGVYLPEPSKRDGDHGGRRSFRVARLELKHRAQEASA